MAEKSWFWGGTTVGDAGPYNDEEFCDLFKFLIQGDPSTQGPIKNVYNELAVTAVDTDTIQMDTGAAMVDGRLYINSSALQKDLVDRGVGLPNYYVLILRKDFDAQTVTAELLLDAAAYPAVTQNDSSEWEIALYRILVPGGGEALVITDVRDFCAFNTVLRDSIIDSGDSIVDGAIPRDKLEAKLVKVLVPINASNFEGQNAMYPIASPGWGYATSTSGWTWFKGFYILPDDVVPSGFSAGVGVKSYSLFSCHLEEAWDRTIVAYSNIRADNIGAVGKEDDTDDYAAIELDPLEFNYIHELEIEAAAGDIITLHTARAGAYLDDTQSSAGLLGVGFWGWLIEYYVSE